MFYSSDITFFFLEKLSIVPKSPKTFIIIMYFYHIITISLYRSLGNLVAVQSPRVPKLGMFVGPPELPTGYRARTQEDKGKHNYCILYTVHILNSILTNICTYNFRETIT